MLRSFFQSLLAVVTLGMVPLGCSNKPDAPVTPTDVTFHVPAMN